MNALLPGQRPGSPWGWGVAKFDYYSASVEGADLDRVVAALKWELERQFQLQLLSFSPCRAKNGYLHGVMLHRGERVIAECWSGGNPGVHVQSKGQDSRLVAPALRAQFPVHAVARADVATDWISEGLFDVLAPMMQAFALDHELKLRYEGDWTRKEGRSLYVGSSRSSVYCVLYEKGYQEGGSASKHWVRFEVRVQPHSTKKQACCSWTEEQFLGASAWVSELVDQLGLATPEPMSASRPWRNRSAEKARLWLLTQGKRVIREWLVDCGGCPADFGEAVVRALDELEASEVVPEVGEPIGWFNEGFGR